MARLANAQRVVSGKSADAERASLGGEDVEFRLTNGDLELLRTCTRTLKPQTC